MLHKISIALLLVFISTKVFSQQDSLKTKSYDYAIVEIKKVRSIAYGAEFVTVYYEDGKTEDLTGKLYKEKKNIDTTTKNLESDDFYPDITKNAGIPMAKRALLCAKYMKEKGYYLVNSTVVSNGGEYSPYTPTKYQFYNNQYIFEKKEK